MDRARVTMRLGEKGQTAPALLLLLVVLLGAGVMMFQVGLATDLRSQAQTAADAAALAAVHNLEDQYRSWYLTHSPDEPMLVDEAAMQAAAADYAARNDGTLTRFERDGLEAYVEVESNDALSGDAESIDREDAEGTAAARAELHLVYSLGGLPNVGLTSGGNGLPASEVKDLEDETGTKVHPQSALRRYGSDCFAGVDVVNLTKEMKISIIKAEDKIGPLVLNDGFRTYACQEYLFGTVTGPVAPPGRSMHNYGMAVDVANYGALATVAGAVGLCQPLPDNDAVHFSLSSGPECGGARGAAAGGPFGGGLGGFVSFEPRLID